MQTMKLEKRKNVLAIFLAFLLGILLSQVASSIYSQPASEYGIISNELEATEIEWTNFPAWRKFSCEINGCFTMRLPHKKTISITGVGDDNTLKELKRSSHLRVVDGKLAICDDVTYQIEYWNITSDNISKGLNEIADAQAGYYLEATCEENCFVLGYALPMRYDMELWGEQENRYKEQRIDPYLSSHELSDTYDMIRNENLVLTRDENMTLSCSIQNKGQETWCFQDDLPQIEMWYQGVWLVLDDGVDSTCMLRDCAPGEEIKISIPKDIEERYNNLLTGIYRIVIKGTENDYIVSDCFEKGG